MYLKKYYSTLEEYCILFPVCITTLQKEIDYILPILFQYFVNLDNIAWPKGNTIDTIAAIDDKDILFAVDGSCAACRRHHLNQHCFY